MATKPKSGSRGKGGAAAARKRNAAQKRAKRQMQAVILFAAGVLVGALTLVSGASAWNWLHNALFGLFGWGAIFVCVLLIYIAALLTMDKPVKGRAWMGGFLILFLRVASNLCDGYAAVR